MSEGRLERHVIIESPYAGDLERNAIYLKRTVNDCIARGEIPFASHGFYTHFLDDANPAERTRGIELGYKWWPKVDALIFYTDYGMSPGMMQALEWWTDHSSEPFWSRGEHGRPQGYPRLEIRRIGEN